MNLVSIKRFLVKFGLNKKCKFRTRQFGKDNEVFCLQMTPSNHWLLSYMKEGKIKREFYFFTLEMAFYFIREKTLNLYNRNHSWYKDKNIEKEFEVFNREKVDFKKRFEHIKNNIEANSRMWLPEGEDKFFDYKLLNEEISYTENFVKKLKENKFFSVVPESKQKMQTSTITYDLINNLYCYLYMDRGNPVWGSCFNSISDAFLYMRAQALSVFISKQSVIIEQWKQDIKDKRNRFKFYCGTNRKKRPGKVGPLTQRHLILFIGDLKYKYSKTFLRTSYKNPEYHYIKAGILNWSTYCKGEIKRFYFEYSAKKFLFDQEYKNYFSELIRQNGCKKKAWLQIYELEFKRATQFYKEKFSERYNNINVVNINGYAPDHAIMSGIWNPDNLSVTAKAGDKRWNSFLQAHCLLERYGDLYGAYVSIYPTPFEKLSLVPADRIGEYHILKVMKTIPGISFKVPPFYGQPGGGIIYYLCEPISELLRKGALELIR